VTPECGSAKKRSKKRARKNILTARGPGREALEARMGELRVLTDSNMEVQVQAWQAYYGRPDVAITDGEDSLRKQEGAAEWPAQCMVLQAASRHVAEAT
jgi:hypothetical protein